MSARSIGALACGCAVGLAINALIPFINPLRPIGHDGLMSFAVAIDIITSPFHAIVALIICVPSWLLLAKTGRNTVFDAVGLGFVVAFVLTSLYSPLYRDISLFWWSIMECSLKALPGAAAGLVTWVVAHPRQRLAEATSGS